jgi:CBS domain-containing protein
MNAAQLLDFKGHDVLSVHESRSVADAAALMREHGVGALLVTDGSEPFVGILSERDIVYAVSSRGAEALADEVSFLMSRDVISVSPETSTATLMTIMTEERIRHIPVVAKKRLVGLVSIGDVVRARVGELERDRQDLLDYVSAR